jgi:flagellar L-ring protein precursor FlgH
MHTNQYRLFAAILAIILLIGFSGCAGNQKDVQPAMQEMPSRELLAQGYASPPVVDHDGSLWQANSSLNGLFIDTKARNVGDIVTVKIEESAEAKNKARTETERSSSLEAGIEKMFGLEDWWQNEVLDNVSDSIPKIDPFGTPSVKGSLASGFDGEGETSRSGDLSAFITCRVVAVMPNGNLKIVGTREVMVNHETQMIILSGVIRPRDITEENVILSTFISDAKIAYSGSGVIDERQRPGWLANLLNTVWPF